MDEINLYHFLSLNLSLTYLFSAKPPYQMFWNPHSIARKFSVVSVFSYNWLPCRRVVPGKWLFTPRFPLDWRARETVVFIFWTFPLMENIVFFYTGLIFNPLFYSSEWTVVHRVRTAGWHTRVHVYSHAVSSNEPIHIAPVRSWIHLLVSDIHYFSSRLLKWSSAGFSALVFLSSITCTTLIFVLLYLSHYLILIQSLVKVFCLFIVHRIKTMPLWFQL